MERTTSPFGCDSTTVHWGTTNTRPTTPPVALKCTKKAFHQVGHHCHGSRQVGRPHWPLGVSSSTPHPPCATCPSGRVSSTIVRIASGTSRTMHSSWNASTHPMTVARAWPVPVTHRGTASREWSAPMWTCPARTLISVHHRPCQRPSPPPMRTSKHHFGGDRTLCSTLMVHTNVTAKIVRYVML